ncbi:MULTISPECIES: LrgB family protein [Cytobacillus]|uniref:LrgB family protein n=1 Tax=Cytobacillus TaxID=2675230 RepID=UPI001CD47094|nr:LrgB family protein [Cytobacillus kochii]MCA1028977.1 LrgB family protein [Cytobacillus kochii]MCM3324405.1 LrgB family protein [Cytobacillus kochii]MCM3346799.1 LrgB family protein [Cytobacillus kochii]MDM5206050.1 LrgB family protein [Cytobacillus kochii]
MRDIFFSISMILLTLVIYFVVSSLYKRYPLPILLPILSGTVLMIIILVSLGISYDKYMEGGQFITSLLGPTVVALAYPLYKQRDFLKKYLFTIIGGAFIATLTAMLSVGLLGKALRIDSALIISMLPKSLTTPVAIEVAKVLEGNASMAVVGVTITGIFGVIISPYIFKYLRIYTSIGRGIALGGTSHAMGTAKAAEYDELAFSISSITMSICAIIGSIIGPLIVWILQM